MRNEDAARQRAIRPRLLDRAVVRRAEVVLRVHVSTVQHKDAGQPLGLVEARRQERDVLDLVCALMLEAARLQHAAVQRERGFARIARRSSLGDLVATGAVKKVGRSSAFISAVWC